MAKELVQKLAYVAPSQLGQPEASKKFMIRADHFFVNVAHNLFHNDVWEISTAAMAKELTQKLFVTETALAPPAAAAAASQVGQAEAEKAPEVDLAPVPKKAALAHPARPSAGTAWKKAMIRADRFLLKVADNKLFHYDVSINPEPKSRQTLSELIKVHGNTPLGGKLPAYDGRKSLYAAGSLPFESEEFTVRLVDPEKKDKERAEREYRSTIRIAGRTDLYHQETIRVLNVVLRKSPSWKYVTVSRSFLSTTFGLRGDIGEGLECWRGYYQSLRPTQMGLSLNLDMSGTSIFMPVVVIRSAQEFLNLHDVSRLLNDRDRVKVVALMDCPEITKYRGLVSAQPHRQEIIEVSSVIKDPQRGTVNGGMIREVLIAFGRNTGRRPERTIFYRDGVSEGQFSHVLLHEMDALQKVSKGHITLDDAVFPNGTTGHALEDLEKVATDLRASFWKQMSDAGIKYIPSNTFSYYDQVLDTTAMLGAVPDRYSWTGGEIGHDTYFSMARGNATVPAMEMTKWFDTSYRFIIPELSPETKFSYASHKAVSEYKEAKVVPINPESKSRQELIKLHGKTSLGSKLPAYDGRKSLYTAGSLPFESVDPEKKDKERDEREYRITIQIAGRTDLYHLQQFLCRRQRDMAQETIQVLDVVLEPYSRESPFWNYVTVSKSFFLTTFGHRGDIGEGLECWRGYYQSLCPSQMGLLLNIATSFFKKVFAQEFLNLRDVSWPLTDRDRVKIKKALRGVRVETNRQTNQIRRYKITGLTNVPMSQLIGTRMSVVHYFDDYKLQHTNWPCLQSGSDSRPVYLPMEACKIIQGKRYFKKLNDKQVTNILRATCQRPQQREQSICEMVLYNKYAEDKFAQEFGIKVCSDLALVPARVLPPPMLRYHDTGRDRTCAPSAGQWNMINKKVINGGVRDNWACLNFSHVRPEELYRFLIQMCNATGMLVCPRPVVDIRSAVSEVPTIIFGADVTHPPPGQDSASSISAGTIRPTHYHVLYDENHFTADAIESPNNNLCYTYGCYTRAVSGVEGHCSDGCSIPDSSRQAANTEESHSRAIQGLVRILDKTFCLPFTMDMLVEEVVASVFKTLNISFDHWVKVNNKVASPGRKLCTMVDINDKEFSLYISPRLRGGTRNINRNLITKKPLLDHIISISENLFDVVLFPRRLHYPGMTPYLIGLQDVSINLVILLINLVHQNYPKHCPGRFTHSSILYCVETNELSFDPEVGQFDYSEELYYQNLSDLAEVLSEIFLYSEEFLFANRPSLHVYGTRPANNTWRLPRLLNFLVHDLKKTVRKFPLDIPKNRKYLEEHIGILSGAARFAYLLACELDVGYDGDENDIEFHIGMVEEPDPHPVPEPQPSAPEAPAQLPHPAPQPQPEITLLHKSSQPWKLSSQPQSEPPPTRQKRRNFVKVPCWRRKANKSSVFARLFDTRDYETQRVGSQWSYGRNWVGHSRKYFWKLSTKQAEAFLQLIFAALMYNIRLRMHCPEVPVDWAEGPCPIPHHAGFNRHNYTKLGPQCIYARRVNRVTNRLAKFNCCR